jgi:hypothetical protein
VRVNHVDDVSRCETASNIRSNPFTIIHSILQPESESSKSSPCPRKYRAYIALVPCGTSNGHPNLSYIYG